MNQAQAGVLPADHADHTDSEGIQKSSSLRRPGPGKSLFRSVCSASSVGKKSRLIQIGPQNTWGGTNPMVILHLISMSDNTSFSLAGKVALVTGSSKGLGRSMAIALGKAGAKVAINYCNNPSKAEEALAALKAAGCQGALFRADVTDEAEVNRMHAEISRQLGPVDILVINATCDQPHKPIEQYDWAFYQSMLDFFIKSPFLLTRACLPHMKQNKWGRIINIGSEVVARGVPNFTAYVAAKGGQNGFNRSLATELAPTGITVNMIAPGWIPVERHENDPQAEKDGYRALIPVNRWGVPDDLSGAVVFLASPSSSFVTGQTLHVNGGLTVC